QPVPDASGGVPTPLPVPEARVDPLDQAHADRVAIPVTVRVKVLVDQSLIDERSDWIDYVQRTVSAASHVYEPLFGVRLELASVGRWAVPLEGMGAQDLLADLKAHSREGSDLLVGFTSRPFDGTTSGTADTPLDDSPFNGAYGVVYATPGHRRAHLRTLLHEVGHMFGAKDIVDPEHPGWKGGSWMSYATVPETQEPWIDLDNRQRVIDRKDMPFAPEAPGPSPTEP
ncbi:MAG: hypothetical protein KDK70_39930, partial [Myxococcales bacterium]|nr:hypothetical protein [Myxococcales bacterium]